MASRWFSVRRLETMVARCGLLTLDAVGGEETDVARLQRIVVGELRAAGLRLRLPRQGGVVHLHRERGGDRKVRRKEAALIRNVM